MNYREVQNIIFKKYQIILNQWDSGKFDFEDLETSKEFCDKQIKKSKFFPVFDMGSSYEVFDTAGGYWYSFKKKEQALFLHDVLIKDFKKSSNLVKKQSAKNIRFGDLTSQNG